MERWAGRVALVTGASVGIGAAVTKILIKHGMKVAGCGRNLEKLEELEKQIEGAAGCFLPIQCDVSEEEQVKSMFKRVKDEWKGVDVLINNAGLAHNAPLLTGDTEQWRHMLEVNVLGLSICTREAYQSMKNRKIDDGHIINISSMSGHRVVSSRPTHFYSATKHAVKALTDGVRNELREMKSNIRITEISPGLVETEFQARLNGEAAAEKVYSRLKCLQGDDIADSVIYALSAPPHVQVHDILIRPTTQVS